MLTTRIARLTPDERSEIWERRWRGQSLSDIAPARQQALRADDRAPGCRIGHAVGRHDGRGRSGCHPGIGVA